MNSIKIAFALILAMAGGADAITVNPASSVLGDSAATGLTIPYRDANGDFQVNRITFTAAGGLTVSGLTSGSVLFSGAGGAVSQNNANFFWDNTNTRLGVGTASPVTNVEVSGSGPIIRATALPGTTFSSFQANNTGGNCFFGRESSAGNSITNNGAAYAGIIDARGTNPLQFAVNDNIAVTILSAGGVGIATQNPATKLHLSSGIFTVDGTSGGLTISSAANTGVLISGILSATAVFNPGSIAANTCTDSSAITVNGAVDASECWVGAPAANASVAGVSHVCYVSAANAVKVRACCDTVGACVATSQTYRVTVVLH